MPRWRLGVALLIPEPFATEINGLRRALGDGSFDRIPPHITLVPPVNVRVDDVTAAMAVLRKACRELEPFDVELGPVATFYPNTPAVILAVKRGGSESVLRLRDAVFIRPLARSLSWPFVPHVTLSDEVEPERINHCLKAMESFGAAVEFDRVHLLREEAGRKWIPIADATFGAPSVVGRGGREVELFESRLLDPVAKLLFDSVFAKGPVDIGPVHLSDDGAKVLFDPRSLIETDIAVAAHVDGSVVGVVAGRLDGSVFMLNALIVAPTHRNQGIGSHLVAAVCLAAAKTGARQLSSDSALGISDFLEHMGFVHDAYTGQLQRYV